MSASAALRPRTRGRRRNRQSQLALAILSAAAAAAIAYASFRSGRTDGREVAPSDAAATPALSQPPSVQLTDVDPAIVAAVEKARRDVSGAPRSAAAWGHLGMVLYAHRFFSEATVSFAQAERLDPREPRWPYYQGQIASEADLGAAIAKMQRAAELAGRASGAPRLALADLLALAGRLDAAATQYRRLLTAEPDNARAHLGLARVAYARNALEDAVRELRSSCATDARTRKAAHMLAAEIHRHLNEPAAADHELALAAELPPDRPWPDPFSDQVTQLQVGRKANTDRARQLFNEGHRQEAIALLRRTAREYPHSDIAWLMLGQALINEDDWDGAEQALRASVREAPESDENILYLGMALAGKHNDEGAAACYRKATELRPQNAQAQILLGETLMRLSDTSGAIEAFRAAIRYQPQLEDAHLLLAETLARKGSQIEARVQIRELLRLNPTNQKAKDLQRKLKN